MPEKTYEALDFLCGFLHHIADSAWLLQPACFCPGISAGPTLDNYQQDLIHASIAVFVC